MSELPKWALGPFRRIQGSNPVLVPDKDAVFHCPIRNETVNWEELHVFNPAAVVHDQKVALLYRAEDASGEMAIGGHTSRIGLAVSEDGFRFSKRPAPVLFPDEDAQKMFEWETGCEDPRLVQSEDGQFIMTYTQARQSAGNKWDFYIGIASSRDLVTWQKHGPAFATAFGGKYMKLYCHKSASIVCRIEGNRFIATKINGLYWMYWHDGRTTFAASSQDLLNWTPIEESSGNPMEVLPPRKGFFDSALTEPGPQSILNDDGILHLYNGANSNNKADADSSLSSGAYSAGQALFDKSDPTKLVARLQHPFFVPVTDFEKTGQCPNACVFIEGLVLHKDNWLLYYGGADAAVGVAVAERPIV